MRYPTIILLCLCSKLFGQEIRTGIQVSDTIEISYLYHITIIFDSPRVGKPYFGSTLAILHEEVDPKTLMIKVDGAAMQERRVNSIPNTNLTIKTATGLYNFILTYKKEPKRIFVMPEEYKPIIQYESAPKENVIVQNPDSLKALKLMQVLDQEKPDFDYLGLIDNKLKMRIEVTNIWVDVNYTYFKVAIENLSSIPYDINYMRYVTTFGKLNFRQSSDPINEKTPRFMSMQPKGSTIPSLKTLTFIVAFEKFTLNKDEFFNIQAGEVNGARQIAASIPRKSMFEAKGVNQIRDNE